MNNPLEQLNLRPQERRVLVVVLFLIFVVLNFWFVRPLFGQYSEMKNELEKARRTQARYEAEIAKAQGYERLERNLKTNGVEVLSEELQLQRIVDNQARASDVAISRYAPGVRSSTRTNQFFEDQGLTVDFMASSTNLVEFLVGLASGNSMIHVQDMNLRPDGSGTKLAGNILFVATYQKTLPTVLPTSGAAPRPSTAAKPASTAPASASTPVTAAKTNAHPAPGPMANATNRPGMPIKVGRTNPAVSALNALKNGTLPKAGTNTTNSVKAKK